MRSVADTGGAGKEETMSDQPREPTADDARPERRSGDDRRGGVDRREQDRGIWNVPVLRRLVNRRSGDDRRAGSDRRRG